jgi:hypothetical protein
MNALGALFAPDADFVNVGGRWLRGRQEIQTVQAFTHAAIPQNAAGAESLPADRYGIFKKSTYQFDRIGVRFIRPDVVIAHGAWTMFGDARTNEPRHGTMTFVVTQDRGCWFISAVQNTEINRTVK